MEKGKQEFALICYNLLLKVYKRKRKGKHPLRYDLPSVVIRTLLSENAFRSIEKYAEVYLNTNIPEEFRIFDGRPVLLCIQHIEISISEAYPQATPQLRILALLKDMAGNYAVECKELNVKDFK